MWTKKNREAVRDVEKIPIAKRNQNANLDRMYYYKLIILNKYFHNNIQFIFVVFVVAPWKKEPRKKLGVRRGRLENDRIG